MAVNYLFFLIFFAVVHAQSDSSFTLPPEVQEKISGDQMQILQNKSIEVLKAKCEKNGGVEAFSGAQNAFQDFRDCMSNLIDVSTLQEEIEKAKPTGQVDEVFKKYCDKTPSFKSCFFNMSESFNACLSAEEKESQKIVFNITEQLAEFICFKDGDRIALFIAEQGPECLQEKQNEIQQCVNKTMNGNMTLDPSAISDFSFDKIPEFKFGDKECNQLYELQGCVVEALETCSSTTSANIIEALFKFIRKATPCKSEDNEEINAKKLNNELPKANSASSLVYKSITMAAMVISLLL